MSERVSRDRMFMNIARIVAERGTCDRARVGAVLVDSNHNVVSIGYNGSPSGEAHCDEVGHIMHNGHCVRAIHAEENCISKVALEPYPGKFYTLYVTHYPCPKCQITLYEKAVAAGAHITVLYESDYGVLNTAFSSIPDIQDHIVFHKLTEEQTRRSKDELHS